MHFYPHKKFIILSGIIILLGCSPQETARVLGFSLAGYRQNSKINTQIVDKDFFSTYKTTRRIITDMNATIYRQDIRRGVIVAADFYKSYSNCTDSTEVAVFFSETERLKTKIEVSSLNFGLSDFVAQQLFSKLGQ